ncbi:hypothetical protein E2C01_052546 [Portunus trituberculatus]|uniref:Uncharacterized protein n=1 Tax=Portunus trituberculatus TaxID=210409 RepID=A0A5B7GE13_PORTR|nr:hypothetical protein [Portunus trituberculatus]
MSICEAGARRGFPAAASLPEGRTLQIDTRRPRVGLAGLGIYVTSAATTPAVNTATVTANPGRACVTSTGAASFVTKTLGLSGLWTGSGLGRWAEAVGGGGLRHVWTSRHHHHPHSARVSIVP